MTKLNINVPEDREEFLNKYYKDFGKQSMQNRLEGLVDLYRKEIKYPFNCVIMGFPKLHIKNKDFHEGMILNMANMLGMSSITIEAGK